MKILFVCTGNTCRSPMAEFYFNYKSKLKNLPYTASSAGIFAYEGYPISEMAKLVLSHYKIPYKPDFVSKRVSDFLLKSSKFVLTMENFHKTFLQSYFPDKKILTLPEFVGEKNEILDPAGKELNLYFKTFELIRRYVDLIFEKEEVLK